ncbi:MAG TPA: hypothetical protein VG347_08045 [Verrucomicrobiae bacterium]|nr:hypothetical protein [Verrucomicrobiae bacterium]
MQASNLPEMAGIFVLCWLILGVPCLLLVLVGSYLIKRFQIHCRGFLKQVRFTMLVWAVPVAGLIFGAGSGYLTAWSYRYDLETRGNQNWVDVLAIPGAPGDAMANVYGGDWQDDEAWDYRDDIATWDALFWASIASAAMMVIWFMFRVDKWKKEIEVSSNAQPHLLPLSPGQPSATILDAGSKMF